MKKKPIKLSIKHLKYTDYTLQYDHYETNTYLHNPNKGKLNIQEIPFLFPNT